MKKILAQGYLWLLLLILYAPIIIIAIFSFTESKVLGNWTGFSTALYTRLFSGGVNSSLIRAIESTLFIISYCIRICLRICSIYTIYCFRK